MLVALSSIVGIQIPSEGPAFTLALAIHVPAGVMSVAIGALTATTAKRPGRHPRLGTLYYRLLAVVFASATALAAMRWSEDRHLLLIGAVAFSSATVGFLAGKRRWRGWIRWHIPGMGLSYIAMLTAFYVDNGPQLPLWNRLPSIVFWIGPSVIGVPLVLAALRRNAIDVGV